MKAWFVFLLFLSMFVIHVYFYFLLLLLSTQMTSNYRNFCYLIWIPKCCIFMQRVTYCTAGFFYIYMCCVKGISCLVICNANHALPTVFLQGSQRASSQKVIGVLGHVSLLECVPPLILHLSHTDTQIFSFSASCLPETGRI